MLVRHFKTWFHDRFDLHVDGTLPETADAEIVSGTLVARADGTRIPIRDGIPRFVDGSNYADNWGLQWEKFQLTQLDSRNGRHFTFNRFWNCTRWKPREVYGKRVLEAGSGAGRFTEILLDAGAQLVSFDYSQAVEVNHRNHASPEALFFQGDIYHLPLPPESFDYVFCHGVIQHTPDPCAAFRELVRFVRPGGRISIDAYPRRPRFRPWSFPKYVWHPRTRSMDPDKLYRIVKTYIPLYLPIDTLIRRIPKLGLRLSGMIPIPCFNHIGLGLSYRDRLEWTIMDTFDALGARYDYPQDRESLTQWCEGQPLTDIAIFEGGNGWVLNATRLC